MLPFNFVSTATCYALSVQIKKKLYSYRGHSHRFNLETENYERSFFLQLVQFFFPDKLNFLRFFLFMVFGN